MVEDISVRRARELGFEIPPNPPFAKGGTGPRPASADVNVGRFYTDVASCCAVSYGHPAVRWLIGDSFHPGGLELTSRLAGLLGIQPSSMVLDAGSGTGATAVHLARTMGCDVTGLTLEAEGVSAGHELARKSGVEDRVSFVQGDIGSLEDEEDSYDFVLMECVLSILDAKSAALGHLKRMLKPGGRLGLTDVTVSGELPAELRGLLGTVGCVGGALSAEDYRALLEEQGFVVEPWENADDVATSFLRGIRGKLLIAEIAAGLGKLAVSAALLQEAKRVLEAVQEQVEMGVLGYGLVSARRPIAAQNS